jgi:flagellar biosynthesis protein FlhF
MSQRSQTSRRRLLAAARRRRDGEPADFDLFAIARRGMDETRRRRQAWPSDDIAFLGAVLEAHRTPRSLISAIAQSAAKLPLNTLLVERLSAALAARIDFAPLGDVLRARALLLLGPQGAGKTTLAAKIAARIGEPRAMLVSAGIRGAAGRAPLEQYAASLGIPFGLAADGGALAACAKSAQGRQLVIDTPDGSCDAMLETLIAASGAVPILVLPADGDAVDAADAAQRYAALGARTLLPARLDLTSHLGAMLAAADAAGLALPGAGTTPHFAFGLRPLTPGLLARRLLSGALRA